MDAGSMIANDAPNYVPAGNEIEVFLAASKSRLPVLLKGPTGCGKTRFVQSMAARLGRPLLTVACHEDLTAGDLVGRFLLRGGETVWEDGPLTRAVKSGAICYLDEIVEARADTTVVIHSLTDHRRELYVERLNQTLAANADFMLVVSYNPGYQSVLKDLKPSTRQRMVSIDFGFPGPEVEENILMTETGAPIDLARKLVRLGRAIRQLEQEGLAEAASTRTLVTAALLSNAGLPLQEAVNAAIIRPLTDDPVIVKQLLLMVPVYIA